MIWGAGEAETLMVKLQSDVLPEFEAGRVHRLLGFNKPDHTKQSNVDIDKALDFWSHFENATMPLVSPSVAHVHGVTVHWDLIFCVWCHWFSFSVLFLFRLSGMDGGVHAGIGRQLSPDGTHRCSLVRRC
jgi:hypothetical protein